MSKRILVTGGSGFVGQACLPRLIDRGFEVHAISRHRPEEIPGVTWHSVDILQHSPFDWVSEIAPTHLLHLAWCTQPGTYATSPDNMDWLDSTLRLFRAFQQSGGQRLIGTGSCIEYQRSDQACHEASTPTRPTTLYGKAKLTAAQYLDALCQQGLSTAWARLFFLYGPGASERRMPGVVIRALHAGEVARCSAGTQACDFLHIDDAAEALVQLVDSSLTGPINICSGQPTTIREMAIEVARLIGRPELLQLGVLPTNPSDPSLILGDSSRLRDELGWQPAYSLHEGLRQTIAAHVACISNGISRTETLRLNPEARGAA